MLALLAQMDLPALDDSGPGGVDGVLVIFFVLFAVGFGIGALGHLIAARMLQIAGIAIVFVATGVFFIGLRGHL